MGDGSVVGVGVGVFVGDGEGARVGVGVAAPGETDGSVNLLPCAKTVNDCVMRFWRPSLSFVIIVMV